MYKFMYKFILTALLFAFLVACSSQQAEDMEHADYGEHDHAISVTQWMDGFELFMEYQPLVVGEQSDFLIHLTRLQDFSPLTEGMVAIEMHAADSHEHRYPTELSRPGIFIAQVKPEHEGELHAHLNVQVDGQEIDFHLDHFNVFASDEEMEEHAHESEAEHEHSHEDEAAAHDHDDAAEADHDHEAEVETKDAYAASGTREIVFLKEQQWQTDFSTAVVEEQVIQNSILSIATVNPHQYGYAEIVAPVDGFLDVQLNQEMVTPGSMIKKGQVLAILSPPIGASNTIVQRVLSYERAKKDYERAKTLLERDAISQREYEQYEKVYLLEKSTFETLAESYGLSEADESQVNRFKLRAPISGILTDMDVLPGQNVTAGQKMMTVIDPSKVWIQAELFERDFYKLGEISGLSLIVQAMNEKMNFSRGEFKLLSKGQQLNSQMRTIPVLLQVANPEGILKIGQVVQAEIYSSENEKGLAIPASAIIDEEVNKVVYVQTGGESFQQRIVKTGPTFYDWVAITNGLEKGERVVSVGAYAVKLASTNVSVGHGHVH